MEIQGTLTITGQTTITTGAASNVYSKAAVDQTFANLIDSAPAALNTLKELASALSNDGNYATTVQNQLATKAPLANPSFTGTLNADKVSITGGIGSLAIETMGRIKTGGNVETPTLKFPGTDANDSIVIQNTVGSEVARFYNDYRCRFNGDTTILGNADVSGTLYSAGPVTCNQTLSVGGNLTVTGYLSARPYISLRVATTGGTPSTVVAGSPPTVTLGTPGTVALTHLGTNTTTVCTRGTPGNTNLFLYVFTWTGAHPLGANFVPNVIYQTGATSSAQPLGVITASVTSTSITVWLRATVGTVSNVLQDGSFYVYTVP